MTAQPLSVAGSAGSRRAAKAPRSRVSWERILTVLGLTFIVSCGGSGGSGCSLAKIKGGYPADKRVESAVSLRLSKGLFDFLAANGATIIGSQIPADGVTIPSSCGGDTEICCGQVCKLQIGFSALTFDPAPPSTMKVTIRAKMKANPDFKVKIPVVGNCTVGLDTTKSGAQDLGLTLPLNAAVDMTTRLTSINFDTNSLDIADLDNGDISIGGSLACKAAGLFKGLILGKLKDALKSQLATPLNSALCQKCTSNDDCSSFADGGCPMDTKVCTRKGACMQHLGIEGQMDLGGLLGALPGGPSSAAMDIYAVAGSYADVEAAPAGGLSLGLLGGGFSPTSTTCAPPRPAPTRTQPLTKTDAYASNTTPSGKPYHIGAGISALELDTLGHAFYESGGLCLSLGTAQVAQLSSGLLSALVPSLADLTRGQNSSVQLVIRPQNPPTFVLGKGTFKVDGMGQKTIDDPLLSLQIKDLALDFYVYMDEHMVRFMRQTADIKVPLALDIDNMSQIVPILGDLSNAFGNVRVTDSSLLKESPAQLAQLFPSLLPALLGSLSSSIKPIKLPDVLGLKLLPVEFTSTPDKQGQLAYLGLFLALQQGMAPMPVMASPDGPVAASPNPGAMFVETEADLVSLEVPTAAALRQGTALVRATLQLDAQSPRGGAVEWQYRVDAGLWRPFDDKRQITVTDPILRLAGNHIIEVRSRVAGAPDTLDPTPASVSFFVAPVDSEPMLAADKTAAAQASGCHMSAGHTDGGWLALLATLLSLLGILRWRRRPARFTLMASGVLGLSASLLVGAGCSKDGTDGNGNTDPGKPHPELAPTDEIGRYQSAAIRDGKVYIAAYDSTMGDLAFTSVGFDDAQSAKLAWLPVDGLPSGSPSNTAKDSYRGGYDDPADDVGRFSSMALTSKGTPVVAYQDVTNGAVKLAMQDGQGAWQISTLTNPGEGKAPGFYLSMVLDDSDVPTVAYMVQGVKKDGGKMASQLVVARAGSSSPAGTDGWQKTVIAEAPMGCGGLCEMNEACVYSDPMKTDRLATVCKAKETGCTPGCKSNQACLAATCVDVVQAPAASEPDGTGLYARLVRTGGTTYVVYHDNSTGALMMASSADWKPSIVDGGDGKVRMGKAVSAVVAADGTLHLAYGNDNHQLFYRSVSSGKIGKSESIDDGVRMVAGLPETHWVGDGSSFLFLDGGQPALAYQDQTSGSLEVSRRSDAGWTHGTVSMGGMVTRGGYPQGVTKDGKWLLLDVVYDRSADALSSVGFSSL